MVYPPNIITHFRCQNMKDTIEYKILKYLSENENGYPVDVSGLETNEILLKRKLIGLRKEKLIKYGSGIYLNSSSGTESKINFIRAEIEIKGKEYLNNMELNNGSITNNFNNSTIGQLNQDSEFFESPNRIKTTATKSNNPAIKSRLYRILLNPWFIGISLTLIAAIFNSIRFMSYINNIIDNF
jgi:hypothetical protein